MFHMCSLDFGFSLIFSTDLVLSDLNGLIITTYVRSIYGWNNFRMIGFKRWLFQVMLSFC